MVKVSQHLHFTDYIVTKASDVKASSVEIAFRVSHVAKKALKYVVSPLLIRAAFYPSSFNKEYPMIPELGYKSFL